MICGHRATWGSPWSLLPAWVSSTILRCACAQPFYPQSPGALCLGFLSSLLPLRLLELNIERVLELKMGKHTDCPVV
jgi:hypothetical protein